LNSVLGGGDAQHRTAFRPSEAIGTLRNCNKKPDNVHPLSSVSPGAGRLFSFPAVLFHKPSHGLKGIDLSSGFVRSQPQYPRKSQRIPAFVALRRLNPVKCYFNYDRRLHEPNPPMSVFLECVFFEPFGKLGQFLVSQTRIRFPDIQELIVLTRAPDGKGVVG
jgi:hypothetical protein